MLNKVMLIGNLGKDPEIRAMQSGDKIASLVVATSEQWRDKSSGEKKEKTEWHRVVVFGRSADFCERFLVKGTRVYVEGKLQTRKWQDRDGNDRYSTEVVVQNFGGEIKSLSPTGAAGVGGEEHGEGDERAYLREPRGEAEAVHQEHELDDEIPF